MQVHVATTMLGDYWYTSEFQVGNPPQKLLGVFDTGSTDVFIMNKNAKLLKFRTEIPTPKDVHYFNTQVSSTYKATDKKVDVRFGSGPVSGIEAFEDFSIGGCDK